MVQCAPGRRNRLPHPEPPSAVLKCRNSRWRLLRRHPERPQESGRCPPEARSTCKRSGPRFRGQQGVRDGPQSLHGLKCFQGLFPVRIIGVVVAHPCCEICVVGQGVPESPECRILRQGKAQEFFEVVSEALLDRSAFQQGLDQLLGGLLEVKADCVQGPVVFEADRGGLPIVLRLAGQCAREIKVASSHTGHGPPGLPALQRDVSLPTIRRSPRG